MASKHPAPDATDVWRNSTASPLATKPYRDLCSTCSHTEACGHRSTPEQPIFFCEMFEAAGAAAAAAPTSRRPADPADAGDYKGLCMNCEHRDQCSLPKPEGGVWHCEEYR